MLRVLVRVSGERVCGCGCVCGLVCVCELVRVWIGVWVGGVGVSMWVH